MKRITKGHGRVFALVCAALVVGLCGFSATSHGKGKKGKKNTSKLPRVSKLLDNTDLKLGSESFWFDDFDQPPVSGEDKTLSPYFFVAGGDPDEDRLPLEETRADVRISGTIARVRIQQIFGNDGDEPIEAVYVFPASTRAAVHGMKMKVGERSIVASIEKRKKAKAVYEAAKSEGKVASLLDQERPNAFTMRVANIMPGDTVEVDLEYSELVEHEKGIYQFVYPSVVGPRYGGDEASVLDEWLENPYLTEDEPEPYHFGIRVAIETGMALRELRSPSHEVDVEFSSDSAADVRLKDEGGGDRDFILEYTLAGEQIDGEVLLYDHGDEKFFLMMMQPPGAPENEQIVPGEYIFLLDVSGSMSGFPLETAKVLMEDLLGDLDPADHFNIVTFAGTAGKLSPTSLPATDVNVKMAMSKVDGLSGGGGTELMDGLKRAYEIPPVQEEGTSRTVVVVTDGYVSVEARSFKFIRDNLDEANLFAFGIGSSVNRHLIESMARAGYGEPFVVTKQSEADDGARMFREYIEKPVLTDIEVKYEGFGAFDAVPDEVPDLLAARPLILFGKFSGKGAGTITVTGRSAGGAFERTFEVDPGNAASTNSPIRHLWARQWVDLLSDQLYLLPGDGPLENAITRLGLHYSMMTSFTSFVAVDTIKSNKTGKVKKVKQPLPLPAGVSNLAVGASGVSGGGGGSLGAVGYGSGMAMGALGSVGGSSPVVPKIKSGFVGSVSGSVDKNAIKKKIKAAIPAAKLKKSMKSCPCAKLKMAIQLTFDADGKLSKISVTESGSGTNCACTPYMLDTVKKAVKKSFGKKAHPGLENTTVNYPVVLQQ